MHADIKPDNILVDFDGEKIRSLKLIDFGSAFPFDRTGQVSMSTPEYLAPEVLEFLDSRSRGMMDGGSTQDLLAKMFPWSYDMWSFGTIVLEILTGFPLWLSLKGKITSSKGKVILGTGVFGVPGRVNSKILQKQLSVMKGLPATLKKFDSYGCERDELMLSLLKGMMDLLPHKRLSPKEALEHPFMQV